MGRGKMWTKQDDEFLRKNLYRGYKYLSKKLERTENAIKLRGQKIGLKGGVTYNNSYLTLVDVSKIINVDSHSIRNWLEEGLIKYTLAPSNQRVYRITLDNLEKFLKENKDKWDARKIKYQLLWRSKPKWFKDKLQEDKEKPIKQMQKWTKSEDRYLVTNLERLTYKEIGKELGRSAGAVERRVSRLRKVKKAPPKKIVVKWTKKEIEMMLKMEYRGLTDEEIAWELGREKVHIEDKRRRMKREGVYKGSKHSKRIEKENKEIIKLKRKGLSNRKIAEKVGLHYTTVGRRLKGVKI